MSQSNTAMRVLDNASASRCSLSCSAASPRFLSVMSWKVPKSRTALPSTRTASPWVRTVSGRPRAVMKASSRS